MQKPITHNASWVNPMLAKTNTVALYGIELAIGSAAIALAMMAPSMMENVGEFISAKAAGFASLAGMTMMPYWYKNIRQHATVLSGLGKNYDPKKIDAEGYSPRDRIMAITLNAIAMPVMPIVCVNLLQR